MPASTLASSPTGVLLAAGRSRRMGTLKQTMPTPGRADALPVVAAAFDALAPHCAAMLVVVGHEADAVRAALGARPHEAVTVDPDAEMLASIRAGLRAALARRPDAPALVHPADHPFVQGATIVAVLAAAAAHPDRAVMPARPDPSAPAGGHPVLVPPLLAQRLLDEPITGGLRAFWLEHPECAVRLPIHDPECFRDLDRPDDLRR